MAHMCMPGNVPPKMEEPSYIYTVDRSLVTVCIYKCGACGQMFNTICTLHDHIQTHVQGGSYHYDHYFKTAFPKYDCACVGTQIEKTDIALNSICTATQTDKNDVADHRSNSEETTRRLYSIDAGGHTKKTQVLTIKDEADDSADGKNDKTAQSNRHRNDAMAREGRNILDTSSGDWVSDTFKEEMLNEDTIRDIECLTRLIDNATKGMASNGEVVVKEEFNQEPKDSHTLLRDSEAALVNTPRGAKKRKTNALKSIKRKLKNQSSDQRVEIEDVNTGLTESSTTMVTRKSTNKRKSNFSNRLDNASDTPEGYPNDDFNDDFVDNDSDVDSINDYTEMKAADGSNDISKSEERDDEESHITGSPPGNETVTSNNEDLNIKRGRPKGIIKATHTCLKCDIVFLSRGKYIYHRRMLHAPVKQVKKEKKEKENKIWTCEKCGKVYTTDSGLYQHNISKHSDKIFECDICNTRLSSSLTLKQHRIEQHFVIMTEYQCTPCKKQFANSSHYREHMKNKHDMFNDEMYVCETCGYQTTVRTKLRDHHRDNHAKRRRLQCPQCSFTTPGSANLRFHMKSHTGEKDYICHYCGQGFSCPGTLTRHVRVHTGERPFKCEICGKTFTTETPLTRHMDMHSSKKRFSCDFCKKEFVQKNNCLAHMRQHTGEKPYKCDICGLGFTHNVSRRNHMSKQHNANAPAIMKNESTLDQGLDMKNV